MARNTGFLDFFYLRAFLGSEIGKAGVWPPLSGWRGEGRGLPPPPHHHMVFFNLPIESCPPPTLLPRPGSLPEGQPLPGTRNPGGELCGRRRSRNMRKLCGKKSGKMPKIMRKLCGHFLRQKNWNFWPKKKHFGKNTSDNLHRKKKYHLLWNWK